MEDRKRPSMEDFSRFVLVLVAVLAAVRVSGAEDSIHRLIGIRFLSFSYTFGQLLDGSCCDGESKQSGSCPQDICDTAFAFCLKHQSYPSTCDTYFQTSPLINNHTVTEFGSMIDPNVANGTSSSSLIFFPVSTMEAIQVQVFVREVDPVSIVPSSTIELGNFSMVLDTTHLYTTPLRWSTYHFFNDVVRLGLNVTSICAINYYGPNCSIYCERGRRHYTCDNDGNKICDTGYEGSECSTITDLCVSHPCEHDAKCEKRVNDFYCNCYEGFTGKTCSIDTNAVSTQMPDSASGGTNMAVIVGSVVAVLLLLTTASFLLWFYKKRERAVAPMQEKAMKAKAEEFSSGLGNSPWT